MVSAIDASLYGLAIASRRIEQSAKNVANPAKTENSQAPAVDPAKDLVDLKIASYDYKANLKAIKVSGDIQKNLLDIIG